MIKLENKRKKTVIIHVKYNAHGGSVKIIFVFLFNAIYKCNQLFQLKFNKVFTGDETVENDEMESVLGH